MNGQQWLQFAMAAGAVAAFLGAVWIAWWALFADRPRGRRRCPRCWHDLSHTPGLRCGECGRAARRESDLRRTRRRWAIALAAVTLAATLCGWAYWEIADRAWPSYLPTPMVAAALPLVRDPGDSILFDELTGRIARGQLSPEQRGRLVRRCAGGDWRARPPDDAWIEKYGRLLDLLRWQAVGGSAWTPANVEDLLEIPPRIDVTTRAVWPDGVPPRFRVAFDQWWPIGPDCRVTVAPRVEGAAPRVFHRATTVNPWSSYSFAVAGLPADVASVTFDVAVDRRAAEGAGPWRRLAERTIETPVRFGADADAGLEPVDDLELTGAMWSTFRGGAVRWRSGPSPVRFSYQPQATYGAPLDGTAIGVRMDLMRDDRLARRLLLWWLAGDAVTDRGVGWEIAEEDPELLATLGDGTDWWMRVEGDADIALRAGDAERYWSGAFEVPVRVRTAGDVAPDLPWREVDPEEVDRVIDGGGVPREGG